jgi:hypothetical protein
VFLQQGSIINPRRKTSLGVHNLGLGRLLLLDLWKARLAIREEKEKSVAKARLFPSSVAEKFLF